MKKRIRYGIEMNNLSLETRISNLPLDLRRILFTYFLVKSRNKGDMEVIGNVFADIPMRMFLVIKFDKHFWSLSHRAFDIYSDKDTLNVKKSITPMTDDFVFMEISPWALSMLTDIILTHKLNGPMCTIMINPYEIYMIIEGSNAGVSIKSSIDTCTFTRYGIKLSKVEDLTLYANTDILYDMFQKMTGTFMMMYVTRNHMYVQSDNIINGGSLKFNRISQPIVEILENDCMRQLTMQQLNKLYQKTENNNMITKIMCNNKIRFCKIDPDKKSKDTYSIDWSDMIKHMGKKIKSLALSVNYERQLYVDVSFINHRINMQMNIKSTQKQ